MGLLVGAVSGWMARPADLLAAGGERPGRRPPRSGSLTDWPRSPRKESATDQYRYALIQAPANERQAAWVAVSGYFPQDQEWSSRSYTQLARDLFRKGRP